MGLSGATAGARELWETLPKPQGALLDRADLIAPSDEAQLDRLLRQVYEQTQTPIVVVTLPSLEGGQIDDFTNRLYERWGIGAKGVDKGVLFLVAVQEREMRIEVGYGTEPVITDILASRLIAQVARPQFRAGQFSTGIFGVVNGLVAPIAKDAGVRFDPAAPLRASVSRQGERETSPIVIILFVLFVSAGSYYMRKTFPQNSSSRPYGRGGVYIGGRGGSRGGGFRGGGGFGGFGGGFSGGGGASGRW